MNKTIVKQCLDIDQVDVYPFSSRGNALVGQEMFKILDSAKKLEEKGEYIYHLELGNPRFPPPPQIIDATIAALKNLNVGYVSSAGLLELRKVLAERATLLSGRCITTDHVVISTTNLLISQFLDLTCNRGDRVALFTPAFPTYYAAIQYIGLDAVEIPLDPATGFDLTNNLIDEALAAKPKALIVNSANNPTGAIYGQENMEYLVKRCREQGVWILSDETYAEICYHESFYSLSGSGYSQLIVISSFSKLFSIPGYRTGYALAQPEVVEKFTLSNSTLISCLPIFTQLGCVAGVMVMDSYTKKIRSHFGGLIKKCLEVIDEADILFCSSPRSGFYIFLDISRTGLNDIAFCNSLLQTRHTAVTPGSSFGVAYSNYIRVAVCGKSEDVVGGIREVLSFAHEMIEALD